MRAICSGSLATDVLTLKLRLDLDTPAADVCGAGAYADVDWMDLG